MNLLSNIYFLLTFDIRATILSILIGIIVYYLAKFYLRALSLPPGPIPLPFIGNMLIFRGTKEPVSLEIIKLSKKYGKIMTLWLGSKPFVFILDRDIARETFRKNEFAGRPDSYFGKEVSNDKFKDIIFTDYGHHWEALRRVAHSAVRKYSPTDKFGYLVSDVVEQSINIMKEQEDIEKPFSPFIYVYMIFLNIISSSLSGKRYDINDEEYKFFKFFIHDFFREISLKFALWEFLPWMRIIDRSLVKDQERYFNKALDIIKKRYRDHYKDFNEENIRDFCDALISAKNDAINESKESAPYLTDENLSMSIFDLFIAGVDTTQNTFKWALLLLTYYPEVQKKLRQEINAQLGDRLPVHDDRHKCDYVMAFISEVLRFKNVAPIGVFHKAVVDTKIGDFSIPEGTGVYVHQYSILNDEDYWENPNQFIPERFLENGKYLTTRPSAYIPFSFGRRVCLGEKLAQVNIFLALVRFLQFTNDYEIILHKSNGLEADPNGSDSLLPCDYQIYFKKQI